MAISDYGDGLILDTFRRVVRQDRWLFNQVTGASVPRESSPYIQRDRDDVARALTYAVNRLHRYMGYSAYPVWLSESIEVEYGAGLEGKTFKLSSGYVNAIGQRAITELEADAAIVYSDSDSDGVNDLATITVDLSPATPPSADEIGIFFRVADGAESGGQYSYRILPVEVSVSGAVVTVTGHRSLFVKPSIWAQAYDTTNNDTRITASTTDATDFVTAVDLYRVYADSTSAVQLIGCQAVGSIAPVNVSAEILNSREGIVRIYGTTGCTPNCPHTLTVYYRAGLPLDSDGVIQGAFAEKIVEFAMTQISHPKDAFLFSAAIDYYNANQRIATNFTEREVKESFGTKAGELSAYQFAHANRLDGCARFPLWRREYE